MNRHEQDIEIVCGVYAVDGRERERAVTYSGLGDDPTAYRIERADHSFRVTDDQVGVTRPGRNHRQMVRAHVPLLDYTRALRDERLDRVRRDIQQNRHQARRNARTLLKIAVPIYAEIVPIQAAAFAFAHGLAGIHHACAVHTLADKQKGAVQARLILEEVYDHLDDGRAEVLLGLLMNEPEA